MPTRPANAPFKDIEASGFFPMTQETIIATIAPAAAARFVVTATRPISPSPTVVEPGLKPNQPNHRINTPNAASVILWPGIALAFPSGPYLPKRGPRTIAPARASQPPTECTTVEPAKSQNGVAMFSNQL